MCTLRKTIAIKTFSFATPSQISFLKPLSLPVPRTNSFLDQTLKNWFAEENL
jgi:hypothetical protein